MGAEPWDYFVPYEEDIDAALQKLRRREFEAGRFHRSELKPATIEEALENADADGTRSILDIATVSDSPEFCAVSPLPQERLRELYDTEQPTREMIEENMDFFEEIERGQGIYILVYEGTKPSEIFFAGYSFD
jgi:hypothetical protein